MEQQSGILAGLQSVRGLGGRRAASVLVLAGVALGLGGCVSQQEYDDLIQTNRTLENRNQQLLAQLDESEAARSALGDTRQFGDRTIGQLRDEIAAKDGLLNDYEAQIRDLESRMEGFAFGPLDPVTNAALADLASRSNLLTYDSAQGMLRFNSDLTFASGSDQVSENARSTLQQLASILEGSAASQYDLIIVGHTDSQRISANTAQRHPTNMHLSCHRAISVRRELAGMGLPAGRIQAAGWGEFRPLVTNTATGNTPANRRVEIYIGRSVGGMGGGATAPSGSDGASGIDLDRETPPSRQEGITK